MNCAEPVARGARATDQTVVASKQAAAVALVFTQRKIRGVVYHRAKGGQ